jgi:hypothetical protein
MIRSRQRIVPTSRTSQQPLRGSPLTIHEVAEPILKPSSKYSATSIHVPATSVSYEYENVSQVVPSAELATKVVYVRSIPVKSRTRVVHVMSDGAKVQHEEQYISKCLSKETEQVENERVFIPTPVRRVENERVFIPSPVGKVENERVFVSSPESKVALERVYIPQPQAQNPGSTPPADFAGAAKDDALTSSGKAVIGADGSTATSMNDNNINGDFQ